MRWKRTIVVKGKRMCESQYRYVPDDKTLASHKLRTVRKLYGESVSIVLAKLEADPIQTIPYLLSRLTQQRESCVKRRTEQNKTWKEICEKNYHKSLDHKAFYFKQTERKLTNTKCIFWAQIHL